MRTLLTMRPDQPSFPLLESSDLPGAEDWNVLEALHWNDTVEGDDDQFATLAVARSFDD